MTTLIKNENVQQDKRIAFIDVMRANAANKKLYTAAQQQAAQRYFDKVQTAYENSVCYLTYRKTGVNIKVNKPSKGELMRTHVIALDLYVQEYGLLERVATAQGNIIYRIKAL